MQTSTSPIAEEWKFDHGIMVPLHFLTPRFDLPVIPVNINCQGPPLTPLQRAWAFGEALRRACDAVPERIALVGTGGISHWPATPDSGKINEAWDREFLDRWARNDRAALLVVHRRGDLPRRRPGRLRDPHLHRRRRRGARPGRDPPLRADPDLLGRLHGRRRWRSNRPGAAACRTSSIQYTANLDPEARHRRALPHARRDDRRPARRRRRARSFRSAARACWPTRPRTSRSPTARPTAPSCYLNVRIAAGPRADAGQGAAGDALLAAVRGALRADLREPARRHHPADRRRRGRCSTPSTATCIRSSQGKLSHARRRRPSPRSPPSCTTREARASRCAHFSQAPSRDDDRRRLRDPARLGEDSSSPRAASSRATRSA